MIAVLVLAVLVGLDNLQVAAAIGLMPLRPGRKGLLAVAFGLCEGLMPLVGLLLGRTLHGLWAEQAERVGPLVLLLCGAAILVLALREREVEDLANSRWLLFGLPLSLSFDNLFAGLALGALGYPVVLTAAVVGLVSAGLCLLGLTLSGRLRPFLPGRVEVLSGAYLVLLAAFKLVTES